MEQLGLYSRTWKLQLLSPHAENTEAHKPRAHAPQQENSLQWEALALQLEKAPCAAIKTQFSNNNKKELITDILKISIITLGLQVEIPVTSVGKNKNDRNDAL